MSNKQRMKNIKTAHGVLEIWRDWDRDGAIIMKGAKTINRYCELMNEEPDSDRYGIFFAFNEKRYEQELDRMKSLGFYKDGQKVYSFGCGGYGTSEELIDAFFNFYKERRQQAAKECDPQEVYIYEYNNHECMLSYEGDEAAYDIIVKTYGEDTAKGITRFS